jgi:purine-binding chemotaxis protein CheW
MVRQYVSFMLDKALFGVDVLLVREICRDVAITPVSPAPEFVAGLINLRGQTVAIADLRVRLGLQPASVARDRRCIVLKSRSEVEPLAARGLVANDLPVDTVGLLIDTVADLVTAEDNELQPPPSHTRGFDARFLAGVVALQDTVMSVLRVGSIVSTDTLG